jgi:hypothetical protein
MEGVARVAPKILRIRAFVESPQINAVSWHVVVIIAALSVVPSSQPFRS